MLTVRGHNEGSIFHRKADLHQVATVTMPNGKRPTLACPHKHRPSDRDCPESKANLVELLRLRDHRAPDGGHTLTLGKYLQRWLDDVRPNLAPATWRKHESIVRVHLGPSLGDRRLSDLSVSDVRSFLARPGHLDAQTRRHHRGTLRRALADALRDGLVTRNVAALAEPPQLHKVERTYLDSEQVRTLIAGTRDDRLHALWALGTTGGLRLAEMLALTWANVDLDAATVKVESTMHRVPKAPKGVQPWAMRSPKTIKGRRSVQIPPVTVTALREHRRRQLEEQAKMGVLGKEGLVFTTPKGQPLHGSNLPKALYPHLERLGLPRVTIHDLRHSAATIWYAQGIPLAVIADMLGHSTIRVTADLYRHRVPELSKEAAARMQEAVG